MPNLPIRHFASSRLAKLALASFVLVIAGFLETSHFIDFSRLSGWHWVGLTPTGPGAMNYPIRIPFRTVHLTRQDVSAIPVGADGREIGSSALARASAEPKAEGGKSVNAANEPGPQSDSRFDKAFRDLSQAGRTATKTASGQTHILSVNYSIDKPEEGPGSIQVRKAVEVNGVKKGKVGLRIVNDRTIMIKSSEVLALFGDHINPKTATALGSPSGQKKYVDFNALRDAGINVRYDAAHDLVLMTSHAS